MIISKHVVDGIDNLLIGFTNKELQSAVHGTTVMSSLQAGGFSDAAVVLIVELQHPDNPEDRATIDESAEQARTLYNSSRVLVISLGEEDVMRFLAGSMIEIDDSPTFPGILIQVFVDESDDALEQGISDAGFEGQLNLVEPDYCQHTEPTVV